MIGWDRMEWDGTGWGGMGRDGTGWDGMGGVDERKQARAETRTNDNINTAKQARKRTHHTPRTTVVSETIS